MSARLPGGACSPSATVAAEIDRPGHPPVRIPVMDVAPRRPAAGGTLLTVRFDIPRQWSTGRFGYRLVLGDPPAPPPPRIVRAPRTGTRRGRSANWVCGAILAGGLLLAADGVLTMVWQDPVTAAYAAHQQSVLRHELKVEEHRFVVTRTTYPPPPPPARRDTSADRGLMADYAGMYRESVSTGDALGTIAIGKLGIRFTMVEGASESQLRRGPAHYAGTALPGETGTVAIAGHRTTYLAPFRHLDELHSGDEITIDMPYGHFTYSVVQHGIVAPSSVWVLQQASEQQWLVLTTCHPLRSAAQRMVVVARLQSERLR